MNPIIKGSHHWLLPNQHLLLSAKNDWNTKEDSGKSMKNALYIIIAVPMSKSTSQAEMMSNSEKIKPIALAVIKLHLSEGVNFLSFSYSVGQSVGRKFY